MAEVEKSKNLDEVLKPFYQRASEAEDRLAKLEALLAKKGDSDNENKEISSIVKDFQSKLETAQAELKSEQEKASKEIQKLATENIKLQYRITHLVRALKEADSKLAN
ncbi:uncharacterized protein [Elaeis guineensis]|uniref:Uncharacterized protein LOC105057683 n=1 Tax=Elaeis guineensis var. tenera TaxID=51953 RepID=A0A6I9S785_ELAGV|nr:uncharacterized protein LOC105057683 [Elaeis guineensis]XP_010938672.1 uncharacterized protein LOC105057683 [Elaeis guineensis]